MSTLSVLNSQPIVDVRSDRAIRCQHLPKSGDSSSELLAKGSEFHRDGDMENAEKLYKRALDADPLNADTHHMLGALLIQRYGADEFEVARHHIQRAISLNPSQAKYRHSLGCAYEAVEQWQKAVDAYQRAVDKDPFSSKYLMSLVKPLTHMKRFTRVVEVCKSVLAVDPSHNRANFKCASALRQMRRHSDALLHYRRHLEHHPDDEQAKFWIDIISGSAVKKAPASHVASLFDCYANKFESHLIETLQYRTPELLLDAVMTAADQLALPRNSCGNRGYWGTCVDLGCGTGLMGPLLRDYVSSLRGVDLSEKMLAKAREKGIYDDLETDDIESYLGRQIDARNNFELIVAADVLVYIGDLAPIFATAAKVASPGCLFGLSTEQFDCDVSKEDRMESEAERGYVATITGRFQHSKDYVIRIAADAGWSLVVCNEGTIRCNAGQPIAGNVFVFWKSGSRSGGVHSPERKRR